MASPGLGGRLTRANDPIERVYTLIKRGRTAWSPWTTVPQPLEMTGQSAQVCSKSDVQYLNINISLCLMIGGHHIREMFICVCGVPRFVIKCNVTDFTFPFVQQTWRKPGRKATIIFISCRNKKYLIYYQNNILTDHMHEQMGM